MVETLPLVSSLDLLLFVLWGHLFLVCLRWFCFLMQLPQALLWYSVDGRIVLDICEIICSFTEVFANRKSYKFRTHAGGSHCVLRPACLVQCFLSLFVFLFMFFLDASLSFVYVFCMFSILRVWQYYHLSTFLRSRLSHDDGGVILAAVFSSYNLRTLDVMVVVSACLQSHCLHDDFHSKWVVVMAIYVQFSVKDSFIPV